LSEAAPKVALVAHWDWVLTNFRLPLARALAEAGCEVVFVSPVGTFTHRFAEAGFEHIPWDVERRGMNPVSERASIAALTAIYRQQRPALAHHFTVKPNLYGSLAARRAGVPAVINTFTGLGYLFSPGLRQRVMLAAARPLLRRALRHPRHWTVVLSPEDLDGLRAHGLIDQERVRVIVGDGVDLEQFSPPSHARPAGPPTVLLAARLLRDKGVGEYVQAARDLADEGVDARFLIAGETDPGNPATLLPSQLERWSREGVVELLGHRSDMPELLRRVDIAVLPSYHEGVSRFLLEAAASGAALVATDIPGCRVAVREGRNGFLVPVRDVAQLTDRLRRLLTDEPLRTSFGQASRELAVAEFDERVVLDQYLALYRDLSVPV
jgi:glycosyltransferase involved in cell wall biosynthesis